MSGFFDNVVLTQLTDTIDAELVGAERMAAMEDLAEITRLGADLERYTLLNAGLEAFEEEMNATTTSLVLLALDEDVALEEDKAGLLRRTGSKVGKFLKDLLDRLISFFRNMKNPFKSNKAALKKAKKAFVGPPKPPKEEVAKVIKEAKAKESNSDVPDAEWDAAMGLANLVMSDNAPTTIEEMKALLMKHQGNIESPAVKAVVNEVADIVVKAKETKFQTEVIGGEQHIVFSSRVARGLGNVSSIEELDAVTKANKQMMADVLFNIMLINNPKTPPPEKLLEISEAMGKLKRVHQQRLSTKSSKSDKKFSVKVTDVPKLIDTLERGHDEYVRLSDTVLKPLDRVKAAPEDFNSSFQGTLTSLISMVSMAADRHATAVREITSELNG